jgi:sortase (surface protein transpeptidase)
MTVSLSEKIRYVSGVSTIYVLTLLFAVIVFKPYFVTKNNALIAKSYSSASLELLAGNTQLVYGQPTRLVIPASNIDVPVNPGYYNSADASWTLSGYYAQFATVSTPANNVAGDTFIYGHNNDFVFGSLRHTTPAAGSEALVYTNNGHILDYSFTNSFSLAPDDTSVLNYSGPPVLTIQTCTGSVNEWRTMYRFDYVRTLQ